MASPKLMIALMARMALAGVRTDDRCAQSILLNHTALPKCAGTGSYRAPTSAALSILRDAPGLPGVVLSDFCWDF